MTEEQTPSLRAKYISAALRQEGYLVPATVVHRAIGGAPASEQLPAPQAAPTDNMALRSAATRIEQSMIAAGWNGALADLYVLRAAALTPTAADAVEEGDAS